VSQSKDTAGPESLSALRADLRVRLQARRAELAQAALTRVNAVSDSDGPADPAYAEGLRAAVAAALDYGFDIIERGEESAPLVPAVLLTQARVAARNGVSLDTVLRRYFVGYTLLGSFLIEETEKDERLRGSLLKPMLKTQAALFDRLLVAVSEEYRREERGREHTPDQRRAERVERLLAGELIDTSELAYDFDATHLAVLGVGSGASEAIRQTANALDCRFLLVPRPENSVWAWLGARRRLDPAELERRMGTNHPADLTLAIGEQGRGLTGWRLTHQQARAALLVAMRQPKRAVVRYGDVALLASILQDDLLATSMRQLYLAPLERERDGGEVARETLRAYFAAQRNVSSTAAILGVSRRTVTNRLQAIEARLGRAVNEATAEIEAALRLDELVKGEPIQPEKPSR
jgi:hypothetical protein